jgi:mannosyltransferase OCH1-like enzyme
MLLSTKQTNNATIRGAFIGALVFLALIQFLYAVLCNHASMPIMFVDDPQTTAARGDAANARKVPKIIWMLWDKGFDHPSAPFFEKRSWELNNPTWEVRGLHLTEFEQAVHIEERIPDNVWKKMTVQAKSDVLRMLVLYEYGGVWSDASLDCAIPLDGWLGDQDDIFTFQRFDKHAIHGSYHGFWFPPQEVTL